MWFVKVLVRILFFIIPCLWLTCSYAQDLEKIARSVTVKIVTKGNIKGAFGSTEEIISEGTGFILTEDGHIVTNRHVVFPDLTNYIQSPTINVYVPDIHGVLRTDTPRTARIVNNSNDGDLDFLVLKIDGRYPAVQCEYATPSVGDEVYVFGYGPDFSDRYTSARGAIQPHGELSGKTGKFVAEIRSTFGNSGSPVFSVETSNIIGYVLQSTKIPKETVFDLTLFHRLVQVRDLLPISAKCSSATSSCLSVSKRTRHSIVQALNGQVSKCFGQGTVTQNRAQAVVGSTDETYCSNRLSTAVVVNTPQYPPGTPIPVQVSTEFSGNSYGFTWNYRSLDGNHLDKLHPTREELLLLHESESKTQEFKDVLRNGDIYEFDLIASVVPDRADRVASAAFEIKVSCE